MIENKIQRGDHKDDVINFLDAAGITEHYYSPVNYYLHDGEPNKSAIRSHGKEIQLKGTYNIEKQLDEWKISRHAMTATLYGDKDYLIIQSRRIWIRFYFDKDDKLITCFINEEEDAL